MNKSFKFFTYFILSLSFIVLAPKLRAHAQAIDPNFNPNLIISDAEMLNHSSMSLAQIQSFLESKNSYLANYQTVNAYGTLKSAAEIIYDAANNNYDCSLNILSDEANEAERALKCRHITTINPKVRLEKKKKEQSLITASNPSQRALDFATGYACPDRGSCSPRFQGFGKQVNSAALQFLDYMKNPNGYGFKLGQSYKFNNPYGTISNTEMIVTPLSQATVALYIYTPHVFNGNYNFFRFYNSYFPSAPARYANGSLLQAKGEAGVWLIQNGQKRPFLSKSALVSRFDLNKIISVEPFELEAYTKGSPISLPNYSIVESPSLDLYLIVNDEKRPLANREVFKSFGFHPDEIIKVTLNDLNDYKLGEVLDKSSLYPTGALLQDPESGGIYFAQNGFKYPITDRVVLETKFKNKNILKISIEDLAKLPKMGPVMLDDGELIKSNSASAVYLIADGQKRPFISGEDFEALGYKWENIITVSPQLLYQYPLGDLIKYELEANI